MPGIHFKLGIQPWKTCLAAIIRICNISCCYSNITHFRKFLAPLGIKQQDLLNSQLEEVGLMVFIAKSE